MSTQINEGCGGSAQSHLNVGGKQQCFEGVVRMLAKAKKGFSFPAKPGKTEWVDAIKSKDIVVFPDIEVVENDNTEPEIKNGRFKDTVIKEGVSGNKYTMELSSCTHDAVSSYDSSMAYDKQFEITDRGELLGIVNDDGSVSGLPVKSFLVGKRNRPVVGENPTTIISVKYGDYALSVLKPDFDIEEVEGVYTLLLEVVGTPSDTEIVVKATAGCTSTLVEGLKIGDFTFDGGLFDAMSEDSGVYTFTGTGLHSGLLKTDNVVTVGELFYEGEVTVTIA